ncbi:MAG: hypothetical protein ACKO68_07580 [Bacteroidota bacterium]
MEYATLAAAGGKFCVVSGQTPYVESTKFAPGTHDCPKEAKAKKLKKASNGNDFFIKVIFIVHSKILKKLPMQNLYF